VRNEPVSEPSDITLNIGGGEQPKPPTEDMRYFWDINGTDPKTNQKRTYLKVFSTDNRPFDAPTASAVERIYRETGQAPPGYTVLQPDSTIANLRQSFETYIANPARVASENVANAPSMPTMEPGAMERSPLAGAMPPALRSIGQAAVNAVPTAANALSSLAKGAIVQPALRSMQTPEGAGALAGTVAAGALTGGLTTAPAMLGVGLGTGLGYQAMNTLFGSNQPLGKAVGEAVIGTAGRGIGGFLGWATGGSMASRMSERTYGRLMDMVRKEYPHLKNDPQLMSFAFDKNGPLLKKATDILIDGYKQTASTALKQLENDFVQALPGRLSAPQSKAYNGILRDMKAMGEDYIAAQHQGPVAMKKVVDKVKATYGRLEDFINTEFPNDPAFQMLGSKAVDTYHNALADIGAKASVVSRVQKYAGEGGWSDDAFRKSITAHFNERPSDLAGAATNIAQQGQLHSMKSIPLRIPHTPIGANIPLGKVSPGMYNDPLLNATPVIIGSTAAGTSAIEDFVGAK
jgi:hypothetical protein